MVTGIAETGVESVGFLGARLLFGAVLAYLAFRNYLALEQSIEYARSKGAPMPEIGVPLGSLLLAGGAISIVLGGYPLLGALSVVLFLVGITPIMHDFWALEDQEAQNERIHFLKNVGLLAGALVFLLLADQPWPYAIDVHVI